MDLSEFLQSWYFMLIMAGMLCFLVLLIPVGIVIMIFSISRANREDREKRD